MRSKLLYFPIALTAWGKLTSGLTDAQERALFRLVAYYAEHGGLPLDDEALAQIARVHPKTWQRTFRHKLAFKFPVEGWRWPEIDQQIARREKIAVERSAAGKAGATKKWGSVSGQEPGFSIPLRVRPKKH